MTVKEELQRKLDMVSKAKAQAQTTYINSETVQVRNVIGSLYKTTGKKANFKKEVLNLATTLKEKIQFLTFGKPVIIDHEQQEALELVEKLEIQEILFAAMGDAFDYGSAIIIIDKLPNNKVQLRLADPNFPNVVRKIGRIPYEAEIWTVFKFDRAKYWKRTIYRENEILNDLYSDENDDFSSKKKASLKEFNKKIKSDALKIKEKIPNKNKFIPVVEIPYVPTRDLSTMGLRELAPKKRLQGIQAMLNEGTASLRLERYLNRTKMLIDQDLIDSTSKEQLAKIADENILGLVSDSGDADGKNKTVEVLQGDPKLSEYWVDITNSISLAVQTLKLSELGESDSTTATDAIFNKGNDVETVNVIGTFWQRKIAEILEKAFAFSTDASFTEIEKDISKWGIQIVPNIIMNEAKLTDIVIAQLGAGLINMVQAKVKLESISQETARNQLDETEEHFNPTLTATASFGDNENDEKPKADDKTGNPQPENTGAKK